MLVDVGRTQRCLQPRCRMAELCTDQKYALPYTSLSARHLLTCLGPGRRCKPAEHPCRRGATVLEYDVNVETSL